MTVVALLGATGHIGRSLLPVMQGVTVRAYARRVDALAALLAAQGLSDRVTVCPIDAFLHDDFDVVINAVGAGDPARVNQMADHLCMVTEQFDQWVIERLRQRPDRMAIFISSGSVYGTAFDHAANEDMRVCFDPNQPQPGQLYGLMKLYSEAKHRRCDQLNLVDLRLFGYFSRAIDLDGRFFLSELAQALIGGVPFITNATDMVRDYTVPHEFWRLISHVIQAGRLNAALDVRTLAPVSKFALLDRLTQSHGLKVQISDGFAAVTASGAKSTYCSSLDHGALVGFVPRLTAMDGVCQELDALIQGDGVQGQAAQGGGIGTG